MCYGTLPDRGTERYREVQRDNGEKDDGTVGASADRKRAQAIGLF